MGARQNLIALSAAGALMSCQANGGERTAPSEGDRAPAFTLPSAAGGSVALEDVVSRKPALLYFSMGPG